jgi:hypothetical protein
MSDEDKQPYEVCMHDHLQHMQNMCLTVIGGACQSLLRLPCMHRVHFIWDAERLGTCCSQPRHVRWPCMQAKSKEDKERVAALKAAAGADGEEAGSGSTAKKPKKEKRPTIKSAYMVCR